MGGIFSFITGIVSGAGERVEASDLAGMLEKKDGLLLIDCRTVGEFKSGHIHGSINLPLGELASSELIGAAGRVVVYCASGVRSVKARSIIAGAGVKDVSDLKGGINAWIGEGRKVVK